MSCAGVTLRAPVPNSTSTPSSPMMGTSLPTKGTMALEPIRWENLGSEGLTATAVSPRMVSGLLVATGR